MAVNLLEALLKETHYPTNNDPPPIKTLQRLAGMGFYLALPIAPTPNYRNEEDKFIKMDGLKNSLTTWGSRGPDFHFLSTELALYPLPPPPPPAWFIPSPSVPEAESIIVIAFTGHLTSADASDFDRMYGCYYL